MFLSDPICFSISSNFLLSNASSSVPRGRIRCVCGLLVIHSRFGALRDFCFLFYFEFVLFCIYCGLFLHISQCRNIQKSSTVFIFIRCFVLLSYRKGSHSGVDIALDSESKGRGFESHCDRLLFYCSNFNTFRQLHCSILFHYFTNNSKFFEITNYESCYS